MLQIDAPPVENFWLRHRVGRVSGIQGTLGAGKSLSPAQNLQVLTTHNCLCCMGVLCTWVKLLTDLQILGCELHKNAFGGRPDPLGSY